MRFSELEATSLKEYAPEVIKRLIYGNSDECTAYADFALILGGPPKYLPSRVARGIELWGKGLVGQFIVSGGVTQDFPEGSMTEAEYMREKLMNAGVPEEKILMENRATTTKENFVYSTIVLINALKQKDVRVTVTVITNAHHMTRSLLLAKDLLPPFMTVRHAGAVMAEDRYPACLSDPELVTQIEKELRLLRSGIRLGWFPEIEV